MNFNSSVLIDLAEKYVGEHCLSFHKIPQSGSNRLYFRISFENHDSIMGAFNDNVKENEAFFSFTDFFLKQNINVPEVLAIDDSKIYYLLTDLGDETLYSHLTANRTVAGPSAETIELYRMVLQQLPRLQMTGKQGIDFSVCYPRSSFDRQSMQWDLNYFKYYFLKLAGISFDEQLLEDDFQKLIDFLLQAGNFYFLFRDFQSRNIMIFNNEPYFIDYQGGRRGALQYDIASLLYDGKADLSPDLRNELLEFYLSELSNYIPVRRNEFLQFFDAFALIRIMQAFGTYGFRGYYEKKAHFLLSIPYAIRNIKYILDNCHLQLEIPELFSALRKITESELANLSMEVSDKLIVEINSFSYKKGIPMDYSGNGGGFVFDCRALPNPGREKFYQDFTGKDKVVADYLEKYDEVSDFKDSVFALVKQSVDNYLERKFNHLSVSFGCTGGQHRSVYFAESLSEYLQETYNQKIKVVLRHTNLKG